MSHAHTQIRLALAAALTGLATTGARIYPNRLYAMDTADLPGLRLYIDSDEISSESIHAPMLQGHSLVVAVECCARAASGLDSTLDQIAQEVETALSAGITVAGKALEPILTASQYDDEPGSPPVGVKRLTYALGYYSHANAPQTLI